VLTALIKVVPVVPNSYKWNHINIKNKKRSHLLDELRLYIGK
jgi:hypothetical protein